MTNIQDYRLELHAEAEVERNEHGEECVAVHPGEPCPGYPHTDHEQEG